jgi:CBS domain containing-hemolysin-like protein
MKRRTDKRWVISIVILSIAISVVFSLASEYALNGTGYFVAFVVLLIFILIGVVFDIIGVAVTSATETPFHSMASHKEPGAAEALRLLKKADKVASICNDVVGDICGIVSGTTAATIVANIIKDLSVEGAALQLVVTGLVAGATIGGKAMGKNAAVNNSTQIVLGVGKIIHFTTHFFRKK